MDAILSFLPHEPGFTQYGIDKIAKNEYVTLANPSHITPLPIRGKLIHVFVYPSNLTPRNWVELHPGASLVIQSNDSNTFRVGITYEWSGRLVLYGFNGSLTPGSVSSTLIAYEVIYTYVSL